MREDQEDAGGREEQVTIADCSLPPTTRCQSAIMSDDDETSSLILRGVLAGLFRTSSRVAPFPSVAASSPSPGFHACQGTRLCF